MDKIKLEYIYINARIATKLVIPVKQLGIPKVVVVKTKLNGGL